MKLITQSNRWSCLPTSLAMVLNVNVDFIIRKMKHDGSEILYPHLEEPFKRRSFHQQECVDVCEEIGYAMTPIESIPLYGPENEDALHLYKHYECCVRMEKYLKAYKGILIGVPVSVSSKRHAVAWNNLGQKIYDPNGTIYDIENFQIMTFWKIAKTYNDEYRKARKYETSIS